MLRATMADVVDAATAPLEPVPMGTMVHFRTAARADAYLIEIWHGAVACEITLPVVEVVA